MVEYIKQKKYFYKKYKNGKMKRISKNEYHLKNNKKIIQKGGVEDIILTGHTDVINCLIYAKSIDTIISGSSDKTMIIWLYNNDSKSYEKADLIIGHTGSVNSLCIVELEIVSYIFSGSNDGTIKKWKIGEHYEASHTLDHTSNIIEIIEHNKNIYFISNNGFYNCNFDLNNVKETITGFDYERDTPKCMTKDLDNLYIGCGSLDTAVIIYNFKNENVRKINIDNSSLYIDYFLCTSININNNNILCGINDGNIYNFSKTDNSNPQIIVSPEQYHTRQINTICNNKAVDKNNLKIFSASDDSTINVWDKSNTVIKTINSNQNKPIKSMIYFNNNIIYTQESNIIIHNLLNLPNLPNLPNKLSSTEDLIKFINNPEIFKEKIIEHQKNPLTFFNDLNKRNIVEISSYIENFILSTSESDINNLKKYTQFIYEYIPYLYSIYNNDTGLLKYYLYTDDNGIKHYNDYYIPDFKDIQELYDFMSSKEVTTKIFTKSLVISSNVASNVGGVLRNFLTRMGEELEKRYKNAKILNITKKDEKESANNICKNIFTVLAISKNNNNPIIFKNNNYKSIILSKIISKCKSNLQKLIIKKLLEYNIEENFKFYDLIPSNNRYLLEEIENYGEFNKKMYLSILKKNKKLLESFNKSSDESKHLLKEITEYDITTKKNKKTGKIKKNTYLSIINSTNINIDNYKNFFNYIDIYIKKYNIYNDLTDFYISHFINFKLDINEIINNLDISFDIYSEYRLINVSEENRIKNNFVEILKALSQEELVIFNRCISGTVRLLKKYKINFNKITKPLETNLKDTVEFKYRIKVITAHTCFFTFDLCYSSDNTTREHIFPEYLNDNIPIKERTKIFVDELHTTGYKDFGLS